MNYASGAPCAYATRLSALDISGAEIAYPGGLALSVRCQTGCFETANGLVLLTQSRVIDDWTQRGANTWWSATGLRWTIDGGAAGTGSAIALDESDESIISVGYSATTNLGGDSVAGEIDAIVSNDKWTAIFVTTI